MCDLGTSKVLSHLISKGCGVCCHSNLLRINMLTFLVNKQAPSTCVPGTGDTKRNRTWSLPGNVLIVIGGKGGGKPRMTEAFAEGWEGRRGTHLNWVGPRQSPGGPREFNICNS